MLRLYSTGALMLITAVVLAVIAAVVDKLFGINEPWNKIIYAGIAVLFIVGLIMFLVPGFPGRWM